MVSNVNPLGVLVDPNPDMNYKTIRMPLQAFKSSASSLFGRSKDATSVKIAEQVFKKKIEIASGILNSSIISTLSPEILLFNLYHSFQYFIEDKLNRLLAESPDQNELVREWSQCKVLISEMRYKSSVDLFKQIRSFCDKVEQQLSKFEIHDSNENAIWDFYRCVMSDGDLLDLSISEIVSPSWDKNSTLLTSVTLGLKYRNFLLLKTSRDLIWVCDELEKLMEPFKNEPQSRLTNDSRRILEVVSDLRRLIPIVNMLVSDDLEFISNESKYFKQIQEFFKNYQKTISHPLSDYETAQKGLSTILLEYKDCPDTKTIRVLDLSRKANFNLALLITKNEKHVNLGVLRKAQKEFFPLREKCHELFDTYFLFNYARLETITEDLVTWSQNLTQARKFSAILKKSLLQDNPPKPTDVPVAPQKILGAEEVFPKFPPIAEPKKTLSETERLKLQEDLIKEESERANLKKEKNEKKVKKLQGNNKVKTTTPPGSKESSPKLQLREPLPPLSIVLPMQTVALHPHALTLMSLLNSVENHLQKNALRHALQAYEDLEVLKKRLKSPIEVQERLAIVSMVALSAHRLLEQSFRYSTVKVDEGSWDHNLKTFDGKVKVIASLWQVALKVNLANFWVDSSYIQFDQRTRLSFRKIAPPQLLLQIIRIDENPDSAEAPKILSSVKDLVKDVLEGSHSYEYASSEVSVTKSHRETKEFKVAWDTKIEELEKVHKIIQQINMKFDPRTLHAILLKQAMKDLNTLKGFARMLEKPILSNELSLIVRNICHFEHLVCQNLMRTLIYLQTGKQDDREHDLCKLYDSIKWDKPPVQGERKFLNEYFINAHHFSTYTFSDKEAGSKLHSAMLAAEMLRERAELDEGFEFEKGSAKTPLNYIPVDSSILKAESVMNILNQAHVGMMKLIEGRLLPQLQAQAV